MDFNSLRECVVLYVEDEKSVRDQTQMILRDFVKEVHLASNGEEGLRLALEKEIDIIVTDILMPGMNGIDMLKKLRNEHNRKIPAIITTAFTETEYLMDAISLKVDGFIMKPINVRDLISNIYTVMLPKMHNKEMQGTISGTNVSYVFQNGEMCERCAMITILVPIQTSQGENEK